MVKLSKEQANLFASTVHLVLLGLKVNSNMLKNKSHILYKYYPLNDIYEDIFWKYLGSRVSSNLMEIKFLIHIAVRCFPTMCKSLINLRYIKDCKQRQIILRVRCSTSTLRVEGYYKLGK